MRRANLRLAFKPLVFLFGLLLSLTIKAVSCEEEQVGPRIVKETFGGGIEQTTIYPEDWQYCESFILVPSENVWNTGLRGFLYLIALLYTFLGIAIIADIFMASIERITSSKEVVKMDPTTKEKVTVTVTVWNETVANLTLLALGSSAPEILLSVIETVQNLNKPPGELGPSTIVGSAAFNLLVITAVCIMVVPASEQKKIKQFGVFMITAMASLWAYIWLFIVLGLWSKDEVTVAEAIITFMMFPALVIFAWLQDVNWNPRKNPKKVLETEMESKDSSADMITADEKTQHDNDAAKVRKFLQDWKTEHGESGNLVQSIALNNDPSTMKELVNGAEAILPTGKKRRDRAFYRMNALHKVGGKTLERRHSLHPQPNLGGSGKFNNKVRPGSAKSNHSDIQVVTHTPVMEIHERCKLGFSSPTYSVLENEGKVSVKVLRKGSDLESTVSCYYHTEAETARPGENYEERSGDIEFPPGSAAQFIEVPIIHNPQHQPDRTFKVIITNAKGPAALGLMSTTVRIVDNDSPGAIGFATGMTQVVEAEGHVTIELCRLNGSSGKVSVKYETQDGTAKRDKDYKAASDEVVFQHNEVSKQITIGIIDDNSYEKTETFLINLKDPEGGATLGNIRTCTVNIISDDGVKLLVDQILKQHAQRHGDWHTRVETSTWAKQFYSAVFPGGDPSDKDWEPPGAFDYCMHFLTIFWKVIFAVVPPTKYAGGWAAFFVALAFIGVITAIVAELASLFGCVVGLKPSVTAITFVALGTSLPDTFASKQAAEDEEYADAAVGNVTGSNSVNVFLGLGLPWLIASIYYSAKGEKFEVPAGNLAFSVLVFTICAVICVVCLVLRRKIQGAELGGKGGIFFGFFFIFLWVLYVILSSLQAYGHIPALEINV